MDLKPQLIISNISKIYGDAKKKENVVTALDNVSFSINEGEFVFILGPSGAGKSTLLNILGGMDKASSGSYILNDINVTELNEKKLAKFRQTDIGFVFQFYNLISSLTAYENVYLASSLVKKHFDPMEILNKVGLKERANNFPSQLSGGEQQRVSIARALVKKPTLLLCDEPTGALDSKTGLEIIELLYNVCKSEKKTVIIVTHNRELSVIGDRVIQVQDGKIIKNEVIENPKKVSEIVMNLFKILLIKLFRDIFKNFKQFLSIIFIVCISVTLYVGLDANAQNFENRINEVYEETNIADEWITINPKFNNSSEMDSDFEFIESQVSKESGGAIEKRFYIPTNIGSTLTNAIILDKLPDINRPYNLETIDYDRNNFFFVDRALIKRYEENNNVDFELGDSLPVNINANYIKSMIDSLLSDPQFLSETISGIIDDSNIDIVYKNFLKEIITSNADEISKFSKDLFDKNFNVEVVSLDLGVNGIMSHPENMDNGELSTSSYLLSNRLLFNSLLDFVHSHIDIQNVISFIRESFENFTSNEEIMNLVDKLLTYLENEENEILIEEAIDNIFIDFKNTINARNVDSIEQFFDCFYNQIVAKLGLNVKSEDFENSINEYFSNKEENNLLIVLSRNNYPNLMSVENDINQAKR